LSPKALLGKQMSTLSAAVVNEVCTALGRTLGCWRNGVRRL